MSDESFEKALRGLLRERGLSFRQLAARTREAQGDDAGLSYGYLAALGRQENATVSAMEVVAAALEVEPTVFAEYRLALARRLFDERDIGLDRALDNLRLLNAGQKGNVPPAPERLIRLARSAGARSAARSSSGAGAQR